MPKFSSLGINIGSGFKGSFIDIKILIDRHVVVNIDRYQVRESRVPDSQMCMMQLTISGLPIVTWHGSLNLIAIFQQATDKERQGIVCWPIEECVIIRADDGGYYLQDADDTCLHPTVKEIDEMIEQSRRRGGWRRK